ncbi:MAG: CoA transferase [Candidatus Aenigmatarchaeota archaeon]
MLSYKGEGIVVFGKVNDPHDTLKEPHWWERGTFKKFHDSYYGELLLQMPPWKMTETPPRVKWACRPPGFHNELIYGKHLGFGINRLKELKEKGVI